VNKTTAWFYTFGATCGAALLGCYALALLPVSRTSSLLALCGLSYEEACSFHKMAGIMAVFWCLAHGLLTQIPVLTLPEPKWWVWMWFTSNVVDAG
jgi:Ferric reductase like transmembrane component